MLMACLKGAKSSFSTTVVLGFIAQSGAKLGWLKIGTVRPSRHRLDSTFFLTNARALGAISKCLRSALLWAPPVRTGEAVFKPACLAEQLKFLGNPQQPPGTLGLGLGDHLVQWEYAKTHGKPCNTN